MTTPAPSTLTTREVAETVGTGPKTLSVFLRASKDYEVVGSGSRYAFTAKDITPMKKRFAKWLAEREAAKTATVSEAQIV
ncbi:MULTISPECIES: hypothetical protein [Mycobacteriaceae]|uniref:Helix-turn-helix domain-containing protein n=1 Tax=Mycolicibacterium neoaurum VKM Ac-1815D TaxID=700508 RepID=V5XJS5_MYCNE|nr:MULTISPECIES: hypothetical protein [Mycobacteriaceae]AHC28064.1 hypothetical protein D174_22225 [Mycolicibacterium neoaurum VKM Ac-1815D]AMO07363.1 hypothetical protein MyAD_21800 [Mycolicibacterium neoaurum]AXK74253.1 hypothetical protein DXK33_03065 [Mycolicibacterium neoaurum]KJQ51319.1 hypothetical protein TS71_00385 [Mycolicibacterium neoaurum]KUM09371.1 hypothetical protein AVZ31_06955 [Mycolicibacterium neoaurum]